MMEVMFNEMLKKYEVMFKSDYFIGMANITVNRIVNRRSNGLWNEGLKV